MKRKTKKKNQSTRTGRPSLWGGRFKNGLDDDARAFSYSLAVDKALFEADLRVSIAHATMLTKCKLLTKKEGEMLVRGLQAVHEELAEKDLMQFAKHYEDVHTLIHDKLEQKIGAVARKLHMGRSRNDLVATSTRVYTKEKISEINALVEKLESALVNQSEKHVDTLIPGYTHLQRAQVVSLAQHFLAYAEMLERDRERFQDARDRMDELPLGSAALGGTSLAIDRRYVQKLLRFQRLSENSMDAVSDRDFIAETLSAASILFMHLSRLAEDLILWNTSEFGFITLSDAYTTGSSLMPQKKNPDMLELIRGKSGAIFGNLISILVTMKSLPLTYNRDMQEDKAPLFSSLEESSRALGIMAAVIQTLRVNKEAAERSVQDPALYATDLADYLVRKGVAFKDAHEAVGRLIRLSEENGKTIAELPLAAYQKVHQQFHADVKKLFSAARSVAAKTSMGSTSPKSIREQIEKWRIRLRAHS